MALIIWDKRLETGHAKIDEQHLSLIDAYNRLHNAMKQGKGKDEIGSILVFLKDYTVTHFSMEEGLMRESGYPGMTKHLDIHKDLVAQVVDLVDKFQIGTVTITLPVMNFLEDWLTKHIQGEDFRLVEYLKGRK